MNADITPKFIKKIKETIKATKKQWDYLTTLNGRLTRLEIRVKALETPPVPISSFNGLQKKYQIQKVDGSPLDEDAFYFVLKVGGKLENIDDNHHHNACRKALSTYAEDIKYTFPQLSNDLVRILNKDFFKNNK